MFALDDIYHFISDTSGVNRNKLRPNSDLRDLGIEGDDFFEMMLEFEQKYLVDMSGYRWYFHHNEEGSPSLGRLLFKPPNSRVKRISITPEMLLESANAQHWNIQYPEHNLPAKRWDILFEKIFWLGLVAIVGIYLIVRFILIVLQFK